MFNVHSLLLLHVTPLPVYPRLQAQVNEPAVSVQVDCPAGQVCVLRVHSLLLVHVTPVPV